ncbi:hypothetical protein BJ878DRAFT_427071 [Calycina marina]|uniref:Uncharacterized protein n=1 Tax=Calycina marina TaxID=1763456 RepID=A0A9P7YZ39_9HELO|nr:hypothetical protein BJ878DRAFT_427071 [Calycina marina]
MLSLQIATPTSATMSPLLQHTSTSNALLRSTGSLPRRARPHHQIRTLRIGVWSSYLEPVFQNGLHLRQRNLKLKYCNALNRKLYRQTPLITRPGVSFKGFMCTAWRGGSWFDRDNSGRGKKHEGDLDDIRSYRKKYRMKRHRSGQSTTAEAPFLNGSTRSGVYPYTIDLDSATPQKHGTKDSISQQLNEAFQSRDLDRRDFISKAWLKLNLDIDAPKPEYEIDPITNRRVAKKAYTAQVAEVEQKAVNHIPSQSTQEEKLSAKSNPIPTNEHAETARSDPVQEGLRDYDNRVSYGPINVNKPDWAEGSGSGSAIQDDLHDYNFTTSYAPGIFNGELTTDEQVVEDGLKEYDEASSYEPGAFNGKPTTDEHVIEDGLKEYDQTTSYEPGAFNGKLTTDEQVAEDGLKEYDQTTSYEPGAFNGKLTADEQFLEDGLKEYDDSHSYEPGSFNGKIPGNEIYTPEAPGEYDQTTSYEPGSFNGSIPADEASIIQDGLKEGEDAQFYEPGPFNCETPRASSHPLSALYDYQQQLNRLNEESEKMFRKARQQYFGIMRSESGSKNQPDMFSPKAIAEHATRSSPNISKYFDELGDPAAAISDHGDLSAADIRSRMASKGSSTVHKSKLTGSFSQDSPEETENKSMTTSDVFATINANTYGVGIQDTEKQYIDGSAKSSSFARSPGADKPRLETTFNRKQLSQSSLDDGTVDPDTEIHREPRLLLGANALVDHMHSVYKQIRHETRPVKTNGRHGLRSDYEQTPRTVRELLRLNAVIGRFFKNPVGLPVENGEMSTEPTRYKVLAYDPVMQSIDIAETTSEVHDSASPLTPAEVLLRLSNPAKFFPHFKTLQSQGYEIVSGNCDVLVFRQGREAGSIIPELEFKAATTSYSAPARHTMNPIDGMQPIAATGNFASPTGFVNYDRLTVEDDFSRNFKSNIDVRREEPVLSGRSSRSDDDGEQRPKMGLGKRVLVGGAMVSGASYAIGVVADYFQTGGEDGKGPQGF